VIAISLGAALFFVARRRAELYWYDVRRDYRVSFGDSHVERIEVEISEDGFVFPATADGWNTALLGIRLSSTLTGRWVEPSVRTGPDARRQYLEHGVRGLRYLNLSGIRPRAGETVPLEGRHVRWEAQSGELLLFHGPVLAGKRILVLAPHPDDAEIAAFGLYAAYDSWVVTVTAGNYVDGRYRRLDEDSQAQDQMRGEVRSWDAVAVPLLGGVPFERTANLGYLNDSLARLYETRATDTDAAVIEEVSRGGFRRGNVAGLLAGREAVAAWSSLTADLEAVLDAVRPDVVVAPHPALDAAADHRFTTIAVLEVLARRGDEHTLLMLYTNHHVRSAYYPFGPSQSIVSFPPWFDDEPTFPSVYSHPLDEAAQIRKVFALEAMHDLRAAPQRSVGGPTGRFLRRLQWVLDEVTRDPLETYSYFRRAARPNELLFVYYPEDRSDLLAQPR
jgi:LmbE family N-acetylglucosaminyl deacetylase